MTIITDTIVDASGTPLSGVSVKIALVTVDQSPGFVSNTQKTINFVMALTTDATGSWSADLQSNAGIVPYGTYYIVTYSLHNVPQQTFEIIVPSSGGPLWVGSIINSPQTPELLSSGGTHLASMTYGSTVTQTVKNAWTALPNLSITFSPRGRPIVVGYAISYAICSTGSSLYYMDFYDTTSGASRVDANGDSITLNLSTTGQQVFWEAGPFLPTTGQKTYQMYGFIPSGGPDVSLVAGAPIAFTQAYSRHRMWIREV